MTHIVGFRHANIAYLMADSAINADVTNAAGKRTSSFGEAPIEDGDRVTAEGALKIVKLRQAAVAMCGHAGSAHGFVEEFADRLDSGDQPFAALESTVASRTPTDPKRHFSLIIAIRRKGSPTIFQFNERGDNRLTELGNNQMTQHGSMKEFYQEITLLATQYILPKCNRRSGQILHSLIGLLQSYGCHDVMFKQGVGGVYTGLLFGPRGPQWQGDLLTIVYSDLTRGNDYVATSVRENALIVRSSLNKKCMAYLSRSMDTEDCERAVRENTRAETFDYVNFLRTSHRVTATAEMRGRSGSSDIVMWPSKRHEDGGSDLKFKVTTRANEKLHLVPRQNGPRGAIPFIYSWFPFRNGPLLRVQDHAITDS